MILNAILVVSTVILIVLCVNVLCFIFKEREAINELKLEISKNKLMSKSNMDRISDLKRDVSINKDRLDKYMICDILDKYSVDYDICNYKKNEYSIKIYSDKISSDMLNDIERKCDYKMLSRFNDTDSFGLIIYTGEEEWHNGK